MDLQEEENNEIVGAQHSHHTHYINYGKHALETYGDFTTPGGNFVNSLHKLL